LYLRRDGTRSACGVNHSDVAGIDRTHAAEAADPGRFLTELNSEFTRILKQTGTLVFATVLYCVINITERAARFARAGHPAPLHVRRTAGEVGTVASGEGSSGPAMA